MKKIVFILLVGLVCLGGLKGSGQSPSLNTNSVGRYSIFEGEYDASNGQNGTNRLKSVFKFDTQTGQTWIFVTGIDPKTSSAIVSWVPVAN